jgi:hypothetical protein
MTAMARAFSLKKSSQPMNTGNDLIESGRKLKTAIVAEPSRYGVAPRYADNGGIWRNRISGNARIEAQIKGCRRSVTPFREQF